MNNTPYKGPLRIWYSGSWTRS